MSTYVDFDSEQDFQFRMEFHERRLEPSEILEFCNKVREAGGGEVLAAILPGVTGDAKSCLIARNLNFDCDVRPFSASSISDESNDWPNGFPKWVMFVDNSVVRLKIADALGLDLVHSTDLSDGSESEAILLPLELGASADAFDHGCYDELATYIDVLTGDYAE